MASHSYEDMELPLKPCPVRKEVGDNTIMLTGRIMVWKNKSLS